MSSNHNQIPFNKIEKYVTGNMTPAEKNTFEKAALDDPFLQDAIDGFTEQKGSLSHFKQRLQPKNKFKFTYTSIAIIGISVIIGLYWMNANKSSLESTQPHANLVQDTPIDTLNNQIVEVLPMALDTLVEIDQVEQIQYTELAQNFNDNPIFDENTYANQTTEPNLIEEQPISDFDEDQEEIIVDKPQKTVYPFTYFYDLAVVDYRKYENREKSIDKTTYQLTGTSANLENKDSKPTEMTEITTKVSYMDYLEESMWYFSKGKYKNALKRFDVIAGQYKNDLNALFYGGLSNYNLGRFDFALKNFTDITNLNQTPFQEEALWYKAKTEIKLGQTNAAKNDLNEIISAGGFYAKEAIDLIKSID